jgi:hypothetical protein
MIADDRWYAYDLFVLERRRVDDVQQGRMLACEKSKTQPS